MILVRMVICSSVNLSNLSDLLYEYVILLVVLLLWVGYEAHT